MIRSIAGRVIWPLTERLCGRDTMARYRRMMRRPRPSADELRDLQSAKLRRLLGLAAEHSPFHARRLA